MKKILLSTAAMALLFTACKKDDNSNNNQTNSGTFKIGTKSYNAQLVQVYDSLAGFFVHAASPDNGTGTLMISFASTPTTSGSYAIVNRQSALPDPGQIHLLGNSGGIVYSATGSDNKNATVTVNGNNVTVSFPESYAKNVSGGTDSLQISGNVTFQK